MTIQTHPFVSIVIPVFNEERYLSACLDSLVKIEYPIDSYEIIIVDNGSTDRSVEIASNYNVKIISKPKVKVGGVRNYGVKQSKGEIIVFLDSDCLVEPWWLSHGVELITKQGFDAVGGLFLLRENPAWIEKNWILRSSREYVYQKTFIGACIFIKRQAFESLGGFNESLSAGEDCYLTEQLKENNYNIQVIPKLGVIHLGYPTTIAGFMRRQIWHSSDYINKLNHLLSDKTMFLVLLYISTIILLAGSILLKAKLTFIFLVILFLMAQPLLLTIKRINRYGNIKETSGFLSIYLVDILYINARAFGFMKGLARRLMNKKDAKVAK